MTALIPTPTVDGSAGQEQHVAEAQRAAAAFLARSNPAQYVRRPKVHPNDARGLDRSELGAFLFAADRVGHPHRTLRIVGKGNKPAVVPPGPRNGPDDRPAMGERIAGPILLRNDGSRPDRRTAQVQIVARHADPRTTTVYDYRRQSFDGMRRTSWSPSWRVDDLPAR